MLPKENEIDFWKIMMYGSMVTFDIDEGDENGSATGVGRGRPCKGYGASSEKTKKRKATKLFRETGLDAMHYSFVQGLRSIEDEDKCEPDSGSVGTCLHVEKCPEAIALIRGRVQPKICGFSGKNPMVCCENRNLDTVKPYGLIAKQKCLEYQITSIPTPKTTTTTTTTTEKSSERLVFGWGIGGVDAFHLEFPHMAVLGYGSKDNIRWECGGSLVSETYVLTAAHCAQTKHGQVQFVRLGVPQLGDGITHYPQNIRVKNIVKYPEYVPSQGYHDIALLQLELPANYEAGIRPACLHTYKELPNETFMATGWGAVEINGGMHDNLQKVILKYVPFDSCATYYAADKRLRNGVVEDWQLCADGGGKRADTCHGDSGGPLQVKNPDYHLYTIVGITSLGIKCAIVPSVYTRVSNYIPWIENIVWPS